VKQRWPWIIGNEIKFDFLKPSDHHTSFISPAVGFPLTRKLEAVTIKMERMHRQIKISARVVGYIAGIRICLSKSCPQRALFRAGAIGLMRSGLSSRA